MWKVIIGTARVVMIMGLVLFLSKSIFAVDLAKDTGLRLAPGDCDVYFGGLHLKEQWERFSASKIYREVSQVPYIQRLIRLWSEQWDTRDGQLGQARQTIENPNVESILKLAKDMFSNEAFMFADGQASEMVIRINELADEVNAVAADGDPESMIEYLMQLPKSEIDAIAVPTLVTGFKIGDKERVLGKLDELEAVIRFGLGMQPMTQSFLQGLERVEDKRGVRLAWTLIPEMVPWALLQQNVYSNEAGKVTDKVQDLLDGRQICITLGLLDNYLIFAISEDQDNISSLGTGNSLVNNDDLKPLLQKSQEVITSITYISDAYADAYYQAQVKDIFRRQFSPIYHTIKNAVGDQLPDSFDSIPEDLKWLDEQIEELMPEFQGQTAFSYLTPTGSEIWNYTRTEDILLDSSKPLNVMKHVGRDPIAMFAFRFQDRPEYFATLRRIARKVKDYLDLIPELDSLSPTDREIWQVGLDRGWPLLVRLADIWENQFMPAMKDGQHAWVLAEGNLASRQWFKEMPESSQPLPIPDIATITGLSSRQGMSDAWSSLFELFDSTVDLVRELKPDEVPENYKVPRPKSMASKVGERYSYPIPENCPAPKEMVPQVFLSDEFMFASYSNDQMYSLSKAQGLEVAKGVIQPNQSCSSASYIDFGRLVNFVRPWVIYAIEAAKGDLDNELVGPQDSLPSIKGKDVLDLWTAFGSAGQIASVTVHNKDGGSIMRTVITLP